MSSTDPTIVVSAKVDPQTYARLQSIRATLPSPRPSGPTVSDAVRHCITQALQGDPSEAA